MLEERLPAKYHSVVHDSLFTGLEGGSQVLEFLIDVRQTLGDIGGLYLIGINTVIHENIQIGIVLSQKPAHAR